MKKEQFIEMLKELDEKYKIDIIDNIYIDAAYNDGVKVVDFLQKEVEENNLMHETGEIIYHQNAIEFLKENDNSLIRSLEIADDLGYSIKDIDSEVLASLLNLEMMQDVFYNKYLPELEERIKKLK